MAKRFEYRILEASYLLPCPVFMAQSTVFLSLMDNSTAQRERQLIVSYMALEPQTTSLSYFLACLLDNH